MKKQIFVVSKTPGGGGGGTSRNIGKGITQLAS